MKRFATIVTHNYLDYARMLAISLSRAMPDAHLTIFCDDQSSATYLARSLTTGDTVVLPTIQRLGVKRAKFDLYAQMASHDFVYLDADIIVLEDLSALFGLRTLAACPVDLDRLPYIHNPHYPWPGDPTLQCRHYFNSGILFFPQHLRPWLESIRDEAHRDEQWYRYILPGYLYDNHFLCAMTNRDNLDIMPLDRDVYSDTAVRQGLQWHVQLDNGHLINTHSGTIVKLLHFAEGREPNYFWAHMPTWLAAFLQERTSRPSLRTFSVLDPTPVQPIVLPLVSQWLASEHHQTIAAIREPFVRNVLDLCVQEIDSILAEPSRTDFGNESFFRNPHAFEELLFAHNGPHSETWEGLRCNRTYLTPREYQVLSAWIRECQIENVVEVGAGETSVLCRRLGCDVICIECNDGPWVRRASEAGAHVYLVLFDERTRHFDDRGLADAAAGARCDLLLIDAPIGRENRRFVLEQLDRYLRPRYVVVHDVVRDCRNVFAWLRTLGWTLYDYVDSRRGLALLRRMDVTVDKLTMDLQADAPASRPSQDSEPDTGWTKGVASPWAWAGALIGQVGPFWCDREYIVPVQVQNLSGRCLGADGGVNLAYHWRRVTQTGVEDAIEGIRTRITPALWPGERRIVLTTVRTPPLPGHFGLEFDLVEEGVAWFAQHGYPGPVCEVDVLLPQ
jgi:hypothetical protein